MISLARPPNQPFSGQRCLPSATDQTSTDHIHQIKGSSPASCADSLDLSALSNAAAVGEEELATTQKLLCERENAGEWYADSNRNVLASRTVNPLDDDPPFYLSRKSSSEDENKRSNKRSYSSRRGGSSRLHQKERLPSSHERTYGSSSEEFRGVIDDLTVQNQKLRTRLRRYEKLHAPQLEGDRLLEVRIHGLPVAKRRKLEQTLRELASSWGDSSPEASPELTMQKMTHSPQLATSEKRRGRSSATSSSKFQDSGYASLSISGNTSAVPLAGLGKDKVSQLARSNNQNIKSYLNDIPEILAPKQCPAMTEKAKKKLVVRRLEQLFTGKGPSGVGHNLPQQQEEISWQAAKADRRATEAQGHTVEAEGRREANILPIGFELQPPEVQSYQTPILRSERSEIDVFRPCVITPGGEAALDQRPTRPLDLDPYRTQNPEDNIQYIRHLGMPSPNMEVSNDEGQNTGKQNDDWVYLNLLISMAQLHTMNVTPDFVRQSIAEVSAKFEISPDGKKLRWGGGRDGSRMSSESRSSAAESPVEGLGNNSTALQRRLAVATDNTKSSDENFEAALGTGKATGRRPIFLGHVSNDDRLAYEPIFFHGEESEADLDFYLGETESTEASDTRDHYGTSGGQSGFRNISSSTPYSRNSGEDGRIIFYKRARFCTDLSGDRRGVPYSVAVYSRTTSEVIGKSGDSESDIRRADERRGPLTHGAPELDRDMDEDADGTEVDLLDHLSRPTMRYRSPAANPIELEASGVGGVQPEDNFVINVNVRHVDRRHGQLRLSPFSAPRQRVRRVMHNIPMTALAAFRSQEVKDQDHEFVLCEIISSRCTNLPPSALPPPSYARNLVSSNSGMSDEDTSEASRMDLGSDSHTLDKIRGSSALSASEMEPMEQSYDDTEDRDGSDDDSSIDMLATARQQDPETVAAQEREFDAYERKEAPSISVATAGESSPSGMDESE